MKLLFAAAAAALVSARALAATEVPLNPSGSYYADDGSWVWTN